MFRCVTQRVEGSNECILPGPGHSGGAERGISQHNIVRRDFDSHLLISIDGENSKAGQRKRTPTLMPIFFLLRGFTMNVRTSYVRWPTLSQRAQGHQ
jgi:hypothetical protein